MRTCLVTLLLCLAAMASASAQPMYIYPENEDKTAAGGDQTCAVTPGWWVGGAPNWTMFVHINEDGTRIDNLQALLKHTCTYTERDFVLRFSPGQPLDGEFCSATIDVGTCQPYTAVRDVFTLRFFQESETNPSSHAEVSWAIYYDEMCRACEALKDVTLPVDTKSWSCLKKLYR